MKDVKNLVSDEMEKINGGVLLEPVMFLPLIKEFVNDLLK